ncbi:hypothetical protein HLB44_20700 [Aquincola sp. S2]|uniref:Uncharacterized protein n=1 Tax=Pseudaquabacterium terrae TaxID=2732868 RepID=A0ABX2EL92_9BURK|nr:hypothetical protein [Aquabacterium terrae]NRF69424.1 hypothetical protein [Aquabacterium terrae]
MTVRPIDARFEVLDMEDVIALERAHRPFAPMPTCERSIPAAPPPPPPRQEPSGAAPAGSPPAQTAGTQTWAADTAGTLTGLLDLSATGGNGGATALLAGSNSTAAAADPGVIPAFAGLVVLGSNAPDAMVGPFPLATADTAPAPPTASADQIALCELLLGDPLLREVVQTYCPDVPTALPHNATTDALVAQYGQDLTCRMLQASTAIRAVLNEYLRDMDRAAMQGHDAGGSGWVFTPGTAGQGEQDGIAAKWRFDPSLFTADYAKGDNLAARAFASLHGTDGAFATITRTLSGISDAGEIYTTASGGIDIDSAQFKRHDVGDAGSELRWEGARIGSHSLVHVDLNEPPEMFDPKAVWFDPALGFVTANQNLVPEDSWAETIVITVVIGVVTWGIGSVVCAGAGVATTSVVGGAIMGATGAIVGGLFQNGTVSFEDVVRGAVTGAIMGAVTEKLGNVGIDAKTGAVTDWGARLGVASGKATLQGILAELTGGEFKDAFGPAFASSLAGDVGRSINAAIAEAARGGGLSAEQVSAYRTIGRAVTTAIAALGNPDDPVLASFAQDFLGDTLKAEIQPPTRGGAGTADAGSTNAGTGASALFSSTDSGAPDEVSGTSAATTGAETGSSGSQGDPIQGNGQPSADAARTEIDDLASRWNWFQLASESHQQTVSFLDDWRATWRVGNPWAIDMNGMLEYIAEWDKAHVDVLQPRVEDYFTPEELARLFGGSSPIGENTSTQDPDGSIAAEVVHDADAIGMDAPVNVEESNGGATHLTIVDLSETTSAVGRTETADTDGSAQANDEPGGGVADADQDAAERGGASSSSPATSDATTSTGTASDSGDPAPTRIVVTGALLHKDQHDNQIEFDAQGNGFVHLKGGGTIVLGTVDPALRGELTANTVFTGSFLERLGGSSGTSLAASLSELSLTAPLHQLVGQAPREVNAADLFRVIGRSSLPGLVIFTGANGPTDYTWTAASGPSERVVGNIDQPFPMLQRLAGDGEWQSAGYVEYLPAGNELRYLRSVEQPYGQLQRLEDGQWTAVVDNVRLYGNDNGGFAILTDEQLARLRDPAINVPVSPGPGGTPGYVADNRDTSTPGYQLPDLLPMLTTTTPRTEPTWKDLIVNARQFENQLPEQLSAELDRAASVGVRPITATDPTFDSVLNDGRIKFVILESGQLVVAPHTVGNVEISHAVLSGGRVVIAAGEADIAGTSGSYIGIGILPHSGHYLNGSSPAVSKEVEDLARRAFAELGITFPTPPKEPS